MSTCSLRTIVAGLVTAIPFLLAATAPPAAAQSARQQLAGQWRCQAGIRDPQGRRMAAIWNYVILLYPNGGFRAQGLIQAGAVRSQFQAQGRWGVSRNGGQWVLSAQGQQVVRHSTGYVTRGTFYSGGRLYSATAYGHNQRTPDGQLTSTTCRKVG